MALLTCVIDGELLEFASIHNGKFNMGRRSFYLFENDEAADKFAQERWNDMDGNELAEMIGADEIVDLWRRGVSFEDWVEKNVTADGEFGESPYDVDDIVDYLKNEYPDIEDWIDEITAGIDDFSFLDDPLDTLQNDDEEADCYDEHLDDKVTVVDALKGWQELIDDLGFKPTVAYKN